MRVVSYRSEFYCEDRYIISNMPESYKGDIDVVFRRALPQNDLEISQMINNLTDIVDRETLVSRLSFIQDARTKEILRYLYNYA